MDGLVILCAFFLDFVFGDPRWFPHPVRGMGLLIRAGETILRRFARTPMAERIAGAALAVLMISLVSATAQFLILASFRASPPLGFIISVVMAYTTLAARDLAGSARTVLVCLEADDLPGARKALSMIVGRDTEELDEKEIARAAVETVAENSSDGVIAPLFYMAIGGPAFALAYKAVNTMDSMIGYKNEKYLNFGWAAARLDDIANYIPARITAVLICLTANVSTQAHSAFRIPQSALQAPWRIMLRDGRSHTSPNSGYPEAAMAGALGVRLGGPSSYGGKQSLKPFIGAEGAAPGKKDIEKSIRFMYCAVLLAVPAAALGAVTINFGLRLVFP